MVFFTKWNHSKGSFLSSVQEEFMKGIKPTLLLLAFGVLCAFPSWVAAQTGETLDPKEVKFGSVYLKTNTEFPKCILDGKDVSVEFDSTGKVVTVRQVPRTGVHIIEVIPMDGVHAPGKVKVKKKDFRIRKVSDEEREWRADKRIKLKKLKKKPEAPKEEDLDPSAPGEDGEDED